MTKIVLVLCLALISCSPGNLREVRSEGESEMKKLTADLKKIETVEDAKSLAKRLKKHFNRIARLLVQARSYLGQEEESYEGSEAGERLFSELARIYEIPGVRNVVEASQMEAVRIVDRTSEAGILHSSKL